MLQRLKVFLGPPPKEWTPLLPSGELVLVHSLPSVKHPHSPLLSFPAFASDLIVSIPILSPPLPRSSKPWRPSPSCHLVLRKPITRRGFVPKDAVVNPHNLQLSLKVRTH